MFTIPFFSSSFSSLFLSFVLLEEKSGRRRVRRGEGWIVINMQAKQGKLAEGQKVELSGSMKTPGTLPLLPSKTRMMERGEERGEGRGV